MIFIYIKTNKKLEKKEERLNAEPSLFWATPVAPCPGDGSGQVMSAPAMLCRLRPSYVGSGQVMSPTAK